MKPEVGEYFAAMLNYGVGAKTMFYKRVKSEKGDPDSDSVITVRQVTEDFKGLHAPGTIQLNHYTVMPWPEGKAKPTRGVHIPEDEEE